MKIYLLIAIMMIAGCVPLAVEPTAISPTSAIFATNTPAASATMSATNTPEYTRTPVSMDCETNATRDGFYPINNNPCLVNLRLVDVNPPSMDNPERSRMQWVPGGYDPFWQRGTVPDPFVFTLPGGGFRHDIDYQDGGYGLSWFQEFERGRCYVLKLTEQHNIQPRNGAPLYNIQFTGRIISLSNSITRVLAPQSPATAAGRQEYIWTLVAPEAAHIDLYGYITWASFDGEIDWLQIEMLEPPAGTNYCGYGTVTF